MVSLGIQRPQNNEFFYLSLKIKKNVYLQRSCCGVVVITSVLHTEGPQFDPGQQH